MNLSKFHAQLTTHKDPIQGTKYITIHCMSQPINEEKKKMFNNFAASYL